MKNVSGLSDGDLDDDDVITEHPEVRPIFTRWSGGRQTCKELPERRIVRVYYGTTQRVCSTTGSDDDDLALT